MQKFPHHLLPLVRNYWLRKERSQKESGKYLFSLPRDKVLLTILNTTYHVSMLTDERRQCRFRIVFMRDTEFMVFSRPGQQQLPTRLFRLSEPRPFSVEELRRLSPATDRWQSLIFVQFSDDRASNSSLKIVALVDKGLTTWGMRLHNFSPPQLLLISSAEPGNLTIGCGQEVFLVLRKGKIFRPSMGYLDEGPIRDFFLPSQTALRESSAHDQPAEASDDLFSAIYRYFLLRLLFEIRERGHGGALLIVPEAGGIDNSRLQDVLRLKFSGNYEDIWSMLRELAALSFGQNGNPATQGQSAQAELASKRIEDRIIDIIRFISALSGVDGAIVMTDRFRLLGFGAEIVAQSPDLTHVQMVEAGLNRPLKRQSLESYGTRHRSAFRFCHAFPDSVAFVLSQDGGVKAVKKVGESVILWPQISLLEL